MKNKEVKNSVECPLKKHTAGSFMLALLLGVIIGLAVIIPGISGSTVAIIFGMYGALLYALGNILNDFKRCFVYLIPIGIGVVVGFGGGFLVIQRVFEDYMFMLVCLFAGLMMGAVPAITAEIKGEKRTPARFSLMGVGVIIPILVGVVSIILSSTSGEGESTFTSFPFYLFLLYIPLGIAMSATQIIPGLSATALLMACGQLKPIYASLHKDYVLENPIVIALLLCLAGGFGIGLILVSRIFSKIIEKRRAPAFFFVVGLSFGSIVSMFINPDMWEIYTAWVGGQNPVLQLVIGGVLLALGFIVSFLLTRYELGRQKD